MIQKIHLWIGIVVGAFFSLSGLSGSALVFDDELDAYFNSNLWYVSPQSDPIRLDEATDKVRAEFPDQTMLLARLPREPNRSIEYWLDNEGEMQLVYIDPWSLSILGERKEHAGFLGFLHDFHVHFLAGDDGLIVNGLMGLFLLLTVLTGLWLAWPGWRKLINALRIPRKKPRVTRWFALHRSVGLISLILLFLVALTGSALVFHKQANAMLVALFGGPGQPNLSQVELAEPQSAQKLPCELLRTAQSAVPGASATWIQFASRPSLPFMVRFRYPNNSHPNGTSYVALDAVTGEILINHSSNDVGTGQQIADIKYPVHIGVALGMPGRIAIFVAGFIPVLLFVTGVYTWWFRRKKQG